MFNCTLKKGLNTFICSAFLLILSLDGFSQVPKKFNYQAIISDDQGNVISNENIILQFSIHSTSAVGPVEYREQQILNTDEHGLVNCIIGNGSILIGDMNYPLWGTVAQFLQVEVNLGNGFVDMGTSQLLSVPHSLAADVALSVDMELNQLNDVSANSPTNKDFLYFDGTVWRDGAAAQILTAGNGITISGNTISGSGDLSGSDDANLSLSNLVTTSINTPLLPSTNGNINLGNSTFNWSNLYLDDSIFLKYGSDIFYDGEEYIHSPLLNAGNTTIGFFAGNSFLSTYNSFYGNSSGNGINGGDENSCFGYSSGINLTYGSSNSFFGYNAGYDANGSSHNSFFGANSGSNSTNTNDNTYLGYRAGRDNLSGSNNVFVGSEAGIGGTSSNNVVIGAFSSSGGGSSVVIGYSAGNSVVNAIQNTFVGMNSGGGNGSSNVCVGFDAGGNQTTGDQNTFIGFSAEGSDTFFENVTAIGYQASVTASNRVRLGNSSITQIGGQVSWSTLSDARLKTDIRDSDLGLDFVLKLRPVNYNYTNDSTDIEYTGFLAQEVEKVLEDLNVSFSGITRPENETDFYSIRYAEFVVPLVNAVQEQNELILDLKERNFQLEEKVLKLEKLEAELEEIKRLLLQRK